MRFIQHTSLALFVAGYGANHVARAATSLYIPFFDPDPVTAVVEGVDDTGHTTWRLGPGVPSGTLTKDSDLFTSATLVADATSAHLVENDSSLSFAITVDCGISGGIAVCTDVGSEAGFVSTTTATETASAFEVQVGSATGTPSGTATTTTGSATQSTASTSGASAGSGSGSTPTATNTGTSSSPPSPTQGAGNGAGRLVASAVGYATVPLLILSFAL
ncbi:hypothetical protein PYCCODRAFT_1434096 [Trametes coccinea BRFM310]|uniref:Uncharacterized protein n=1 Tax=Trametes coccinea (strain BRFM310) TaxID=1353009 RepID=A0A1Y2IRE7_TRAC3|nr:hypothetical protein PYCCODRAFT_1434096 [Trametes coccinea BRFM310]